MKCLVLICLLFTARSTLAQANQSFETTVTQFLATLKAGELQKTTYPFLFSPNFFCLLPFLPPKSPDATISHICATMRHGFEKIG